MSGTRAIRISEEQHENLVKIQDNHEFEPKLKTLADKAIEEFYQRRMEEE